MEQLYEKTQESAAWLRERLGETPRIAIVLGSGLGDLTAGFTDTVEVPYGEIPHFPRSDVAGHKGALLLGTLAGKRVLAMEGRFHYYEGYEMQQVTYPFYVLGALGVEKIIITNAAGGINRSFEPGTLMLMTDFINLMFRNPLIGKNDERLGPRFPDMSEPYSLELRRLAAEAAERCGVACREGVYAAVTGPYYETAAEIRAFGALGADAVGMSTVPDTIVCNYLGMKVLGISCITNMATGIQTVKHSHERVLAVAKQAGEDLCRWITEIVRSL